MADSLSSLQKARIYDVDKNGGEIGSISVTCLFNPYEYSVSKTNTFQETPNNRSDVPHVEFSKAGAQTLKLNLIFDTYETDEDVSKTTNKLWKLMETKSRPETDETKKLPPPDVAFEWGVFRFTAVITNMTQKFTLFKHDGTPVRAKVDITFVQYKDVNDYPKQNPTSGGGPIERIWRVIEGDRLDTIAAAVYGDATKWRLIAERNEIVNPLSLRNGKRLTIPQS
jgi:hypothetical protein